jgi:uncharacterized NAD-dependent epimerase/dehydratase family protein
MRRFAILAEGAFGPHSSKMANALLRFAPAEAIVVIDSHRAGRTAHDVLGVGGGVPVVGTLEEALRLGPDALLVGVSPQGGALPEGYRSTVIAAMRAGLDVWSGVHEMLGDDPELSLLAREQGATVIDLRRPPGSLPIAAGRVRETSATIVLTVGTDCNIGKMTTPLLVRPSLQHCGYRVAFAATGQTGILIEGKGIAIDAVVSDFIAGAAERLTLEAAREADIVLVEGQGALIHPAYSGVTLGLMHGAMPHAMVMCAQPSRTTINRQAWVSIPPLGEVIRLYESMAEAVRPAPIIAVSLNTYDLGDAEAIEAVQRVQNDTGLPTTDPVRFGTDALVRAIDQFHRERLALARVA